MWLQNRLDFNNPIADQPHEPYHFKMIGSWIFKSFLSRSYNPCMNCSTQNL